MNLRIYQHDMQLRGSGVREKRAAIGSRFLVSFDFVCGGPSSTRQRNGEH
jgi:hypothetical protein